ncbi:MAG: antibiotic biosynthesis monooxygenase [Planctomycetes bacterium]|nr:antibiotic biosynthesis monooxygenase [Planctomycetota bacterium]
MSVPASQPKHSDLVGFTVLYRYKLKPGSEEQFVHDWRTITLEFLHSQGSLGSRLHHCEDGTWLAYAQWPNREAWEKASLKGPKLAQASEGMRDAIEEAYPPLPMIPTEDWWVMRPAQTQHPKHK